MICEGIEAIVHDNEFTPGRVVLLDWNGDGTIRWWADPAEVETLAA